MPQREQRIIAWFVILAIVACGVLVFAAGYSNREYAKGDGKCIDHYFSRLRIYTRCGQW